MIKLGVTITFLKTVEISDEQIKEYLEANPNATLDEIKESFVQSMIDDNHYWDADDIEYDEINRR
mgnify:FL=1